MPDPEVDAQLGASSSPSDVTTTAPSPVEPSGEEATPPAPSETPPPAEGGYKEQTAARIQELLRERDEARRLAELALQKVTPPPASPLPKDPWDGLVNHPDPQTAQYWQLQKSLYAPIEQKVTGLEQAVSAGRQELAEVRLENFRLKHPTITPDSEEERAIAGYVQQGYPLDSARKLALYDTLEKENKSLKSQRAAVPEKRAANQEPMSVSSVPETAGLPGKKLTWLESVSQELDRLGIR